MNRSTTGLPVHHQLPEFTQTPGHRVGDPIQPSHPLLSPSPPVSNPSQHQSLFQWVNSSHRWPKYWSFSFSIIPSKEIQGWSWEWTGWISLQSNGLSRVFPNTTVQKHLMLFFYDISLKRFLNIRLYHRASTWNGHPQVYIFLKLIYVFNLGISYSLQTCSGLR